MFLSGLKAKSIIRKVIQVNENRVYSATSNKVKSLGLLHQEGAQFSTAKIAELARIFELKAEDVSVFAFAKAIKKEHKERADLFSPKQIGWNGVLKSKTLKHFAKKPFDVLVSYYDVQELALQTVTGLSGAQFKVGICQDEWCLNDLVVETKIEKETEFLEELEKYVRLLKII